MKYIWLLDIKKKKLTINYLYYINIMKNDKILLLLIMLFIVLFIEYNFNFTNLFVNKNYIEGFQSNSCTDTGKFCKNQTSCVDLLKNMIRRINGSKLNMMMEMRKI